MLVLKGHIHIIHTFYVALQMERKTLAIYFIQVQIGDFLPMVQRPWVSVKYH